MAAQIARLEKVRQKDLETKKVSRQVHRTLSATYKLLEDVVRHYLGPQSVIELDKDLVMPRVIREVRKYARSDHPIWIAQWTGRRPSSVFRSATYRAHQDGLVAYPDTTRKHTPLSSPTVNTN